MLFLTLSNYLCLSVLCSSNLSGIQVSIGCCACARQLEAFFKASREYKGENEFGLMYCPQTEKQETIPREMQLKQLKLPILCSDGKIAS